MLNSNITNYHPNIKLTSEDIDKINNYFLSINEEDYEYNGNYSLFKDKDHYNYCWSNDIASFCCGIQKIEMQLEFENVYLVFDYGH